MIKIFLHMAETVKDLYIPQSFVLSDGEEVPSDFPFPAICKTLEASGDLSSHEMDIVWNKDSIRTLRKPLMVQQWINHSSTLFKIFLIGESSFVVKRPSIRDIDNDIHPSLHFNSQQFKSLQGPPTAADPSEEFIKQIAKVFSSDLGLSLVGVDLIRCSKSGKFYIIDANYFPGFLGVDNCPLHFLQLIKQKLDKKHS
eukprot:TRINITY_DN7604_c0_g1_i1.p1 TRINITY_DN7604_c0_g1~~TRINITY_DN7604_c0_g1_i1.p1  ORF type:complete len:198 (-),score=24.83 TRINITY_DN7604_c0_g1_i1:47-640(-)